MKQLINSAKLSIIGLTLGFCTLSGAFAQGKMEKLKQTTPEERAQFQTQVLKEKLNLSTEQEKQVGDINLKYAQKMDPVLKGEDGKIAKFKAAKDINKEKDAELKTVLTTEQYEKYTQMKGELKDAAKQKIKERNKASQ